MSGFDTNYSRYITPRWRSVSTTLALKELDATAIGTAQIELQDQDFLAPKLMAWRNNRTAGHASDLVGAGVMLDRKGEVLDAAMFLLKEGVGPASRLMRELAAHVVQETELTDNGSVLGNAAIYNADTYYSDVNRYRRRVRREPRDAIAWVELSRAYTCIGLLDQAKQSMLVALQLARDNRFILRSATCLFAHMNDWDRAYSLLLSSELSGCDPWIMSALIAVANRLKRFPRTIKSGKRLLDSDRFSAIQTSELASAIGSVELERGSRKIAKRLFVKSLEDPTENSVAQAAWASRRTQGINLALDFFEETKSFEAASWRYYSNGDWETCATCCERSLADQPFVAHLGVLGSFVTSVALNDFRRSKLLAAHALQTNPNNFLLQNNLIFAKINLGELEAARTRLQRIDRSQLTPDERVTIHATEGLLLFRSGEIEAGRKSYIEACHLAQGLSGPDGTRILALASYFHAVEEISLGAKGCAQIVSEAFSNLEGLEHPIRGLLLSRLEKSQERTR